MDWIKKNYDQFLLALMSLALVAASVFLILQTRGFGEIFSAALTHPTPRTDVAPLDTTVVVDAKTALESPAFWHPPTVEVAPNEVLPIELFVPYKYVIDPEKRVPLAIRTGGTRRHSITGDIIPNKWFLDNHLDPLDPKVTTEDPDKDGFLNEDEWLAHTDPNDKNSHPAYVTKLFLEREIKVPFRLKFNGYDGDPRRDKPEAMSFQINTIDLRQPTEFLKIGETVKRTKFKIEKFEYKEAPNPKTGENDDVSELTVRNTETDDVVVLIKDKVVDSPTVSALFDYQWPSPARQIAVKKPGEFVLIPEMDKRYKLIDIKETEALIQTPSGEKLTIKRDPRKK